MSDSQGGSPLQVAVVVLLLVGGGWYFFRHYEIAGLDSVSVTPKDGYEDDTSFVSYIDAPVTIDANRSVPTSEYSVAANPIALTSRASSPLGAQAISVDGLGDFSAPQTSLPTAQTASVTARRRTYRSIKVASWAMDGFGPTKLSNLAVRKHVSAVVRQFDVIALQQIASIERDLVPRLVEIINGGQVAGYQNRYDYVLGESSGPTGRQEQLAYIFDTTKVLVDRRQAYTVEDPQQQMTYDPLVASFRAAKPDSQTAWTFTLVNLRIDLARAPAEVALLPQVLESVRADGRGEDDVLLLGLFQADDAYLIPTMGGGPIRAAVQGRATDIFGRYHTSNLLIDTVSTSEFLGRSGVYDYPRALDLNPIEAEAVTSHLPVFADFTAHEGGKL
ncbi:exonuclease/endonuclease/phosphatase family protein [Rubripirellula lacrimiformis]|nr:deoxyribonuclease I [Rubripirellula lacrimiformis]